MKIKSAFAKLAFLTSVCCVAILPANACSCLPYKSIPEIAEKTPVIFHGKAVKTRRVGWFNDQRKTTFKILKSVKGDLDGSVTVFHSKDLGWNCGLNFEKNKERIVYAYQSDDGQLGTSSCALPNRYADQQILAYFETGLDTSELDYVCTLSIQSAYDQKIQTGNFELTEERCLPVVPIFDELYRE